MRKTNPFVCPHCNSVFEELPVDDGYSEGNRDFAWFECPNCHRLWLEEIYVFGMVIKTECPENEREEEEMRKTTDYLCPKCGEDIDLDTIDIEFDEGLIIQKLCCAKCGEVWREYFKTTYDGYSLDGKSYNAEGEEI